MSSERPQDCVTRTLYAGGTGLAVGGIVGTMVANWQDVPKVIRNQSWPAFVATGSSSLTSPCTLQAYILDWL